MNSEIHFFKFPCIYFLLFINNKYLQVSCILLQHEPLNVNMCTNRSPDYKNNIAIIRKCQKGQIFNNSEGSKIKFDVVISEKSFYINW